MNPSQLHWQTIQAQRKDTLAVIRRDFSASRMSTTKWCEVAEALEDLEVGCRVKFVDQSEVFDLPCFWHVTGDWLDCGPLGPFTSVSIEWLEINPVERIHRGALIELVGVDHTLEIGRRLQAASVPHHVEAGRFHIVGHVRKAAVSDARAGVVLTGRCRRRPLPRCVLDCGAGAGGGAAGLDR